MKKLFLLGALICASQLHGMDPTSLYELRRTEPIYEKNSWEELPKELQQKIINNALATSNNVDQVINTIKAFGALHGAHYDTQSAADLFMKMLPDDFEQAIEKVKNLQGNTLQDFTKLVHLLADKFNVTTEEIAIEFVTPVAKKYLELGKILLRSAQGYLQRYQGLEIVKLIRKGGADVNFSGMRQINAYNPSQYKMTPLELAIWNSNVRIVKILLRWGTKVTDYDLETAKRLIKVNVNDKQEEIYHLLHEAKIKELEEMKAMEK